MPFIIHVEQPLRPKGSHMRFFFLLFFFASNRFFQEPAYKEDKNRVILNKMKQTGKAEPSTYQKTKVKKLTRPKNTPNTHPFNVLLHALRKPRTSGTKAVVL